MGSSQGRGAASPLIAEGVGCSLLMEEGVEDSGEAISQEEGSTLPPSREGLLLDVGSEGDRYTEDMATDKTVLL